MVIEGADFFVRVVDLPHQVKGVCSPNEDGTYNMYLNARYSRESLLDTYFHEEGHMENDDFWNERDIRDVEGL